MSSTSTCTAIRCRRRCRFCSPTRCRRSRGSTTCRMPHGSRLNPNGTRHYSACMMDDAVIEIDTADAWRLAPFPRHPRPGTRRRRTCHQLRVMPPWRTARAMARRRRRPARSPARRRGRSPRPTARRSSSPATARARSSRSMRIDGRFAAACPRAPASTTSPSRATAACSPPTVAISRCRSSTWRPGKELARIPTTRRVVHGVVVTPDNRYAFVSVEGIAAEPGTVEMIDLTTLRTVATVDVPPQAGGIDIVPPRSGGPAAHNPGRATYVGRLGL